MTTLLAQTEPEFLRDVLAMKQHRGDFDLDAFKAVAGDFSYGLYATIEGAARAMRQWVKHKPTWMSDLHHQRRQRFLADLDAVRDGSFGLTFLDATGTGELMDA